MYTWYTNKGGTMQTSTKTVLTSRVNSEVANEFKARIKAEGFNPSVMINHLIIKYLESERNKDGAIKAH